MGELKGALYMIKKDVDKIEEILENDKVITKALEQGVKAALKQHKLAGNPIACWRDGRVVVLEPNNIPTE